MAPLIHSAKANEPSPVGDRSAVIEQRLIDLQVQIATTRSLRGSAAGKGVAALEGEVRALATEFQKISGRPSSIRPEATTAMAPGAAAQVSRPAATSPQTGASGWSSSTIVTPGAAQPGQWRAPGSTGELRRENAFPGRGQPQRDRTAAWSNSRPATGATPAPTGGPGAAHYQTAYNYLLQQDYGAAQTGFADYLSRFPDTPLAGNAQYWLGETHYVRGAYREAAVAFLKGYEKYGNGNKGADSLLKLGLSLAKLKQNAAACSSLQELGNRYPSAPQSLLNRARAELGRLRCTS